MTSGECIRETNNVTDGYSIAVDVIIGHLQRNVPFVLIINTL